jgi:probable rRNA maturation factor
MRNSPARPRRVRSANQAAGFRAPAASVSKLFALLDKHPSARIPAGELSIAFLDDAEICRLHAQFLSDPAPTDVITFPGDPAAGVFGEPFAGEICVCVPQARREAVKHGNTLADELLLYLVHGWLHLAGYDDLQDAARAAMRDAERETLAYLKTAGFIPRWGDAPSPKEQNSTRPREKRAKTP